jgi:hypothetical protein
MPPTAARVFASGEVMTVYAEVYDNVKQPPHGLDIVTTVRRVNGEAKVFSRSSEVAASKQTLPYRAEVPLTDLPPGAYVLRVEVRSRLGNGSGVNREVPFAIR